MKFTERQELELIERFWTELEDPSAEMLEFLDLMVQRAIPEVEAQSSDHEREGDREMVKSCKGALKIYRQVLAKLTRSRALARALEQEPAEPLMVSTEPAPTEYLPLLSAVARPFPMA